MEFNIKSRNVLQSGYFHQTLRQLQQPCLDIKPHNLMYPIFIVEDDDAKQPVDSMPGIYRYGINQLKIALEPLISKGLKSILLFGIPEHSPKDEIGSYADAPDNPVMRAVPLLRQWFPDLLIACDVCLCPYTLHGHCGVLKEGVSIDHLASINRIADVALAYAEVGAHVVAPSDMMDNRISAIKSKLMEKNLHNQVSVLSYSCKFASAMYGPFREAAKAAPAFGNRKCYQLPPGSSGLAVRAAARDVEEGADMLMVKPGLPYLDIVRQTKNNHPNHPLFVYQVSGEYAMLYKAGGSGNLKTVLHEILVSFRRAGADCIISYFTPIILEWLQNDEESIF